ncbi:MAG: hypothetical protein CR984_07300, partial [Proteobacteria bacterium]
LALDGPALAGYTYVQSMTPGNNYHRALTQWTGLAADLEDAITGAPDFVPGDESHPGQPGGIAGDALGWQQGWGNYVLDFGQTFSGDYSLTFWHFGGINWNGDPNNLVYMYVSTDGTNWNPTHVPFDPTDQSGYGGNPRGTEGNAQLADHEAGGETVFSDTYNLNDTFGVNSFRYLMIEKIDGGPKTGKFIDAVGVIPTSEIPPVPGPTWMLLPAALGLIGLCRRNIQSPMATNS